MTIPRMRLFVALACLTACSAGADVDASRSDPVTSRREAVSSLLPSAGSMLQARSEHTLVLLGSGEVLACGGTGDGTTALATCERYDLSTGRWSGAASMGEARRGASAVLLADGTVLQCGGGSATCEVYDPESDSWSAAASMSVSRRFGTLTSLVSGEVLAAGGDAGGVTELYDPAAAVWQTVGDVAARESATATRLGGGRVLLVGGAGPAGPVDDVDLFDPSTRTWSAGAPLPSPRALHSATRLRDGRVWVAGGSDGSSPLATTVAYDEVLGTWKTTTASLGQARSNHAAALLPSGVVALFGGRGTGGELSSVELFDPVVNETSTAAQLASAAQGAGAVVLPTGDVLVAGGKQAGAVAASDLFSSRSVAWAEKSAMVDSPLNHAQSLLHDGTPLVTGGRTFSLESIAKAEVYDAAGDVWSQAATMLDARQYHSQTLLYDGRVLVAGGYDYPGSFVYIGTTELYTPAINTWSSAGSMVHGRYLHEAKVMPDGRVFVFCGIGEYSQPERVESFNPSTDTWATVGFIPTARWNCTGTVLHDGKLLIVGEGFFPGEEKRVDLYDPATNQWSVAAPALQPRDAHTATLLPSGEVLVVGGTSASSALTSVERYNPVTDTWSNAASLPDPRRGHRAVLLPQGRLLLVGGEPDVGVLNRSLVYDPPSDSWSTVDGVLTRTEHTVFPLPDGAVIAVGGLGPVLPHRFDEALGFMPFWRPVITGNDAAVAPGATIHVEGTGFRGQAEASSGRGGASDVPVVSLRSADGSAMWWLSTSDFTDTELRVRAPAGAPRGYYLMTVVVAGIPSVSVSVALRGLVGDRCGDDAGCLAGKTCVDGFCCETSSCPTCQSCGVAGNEGTCANLGSFVPDDEPPGACSGTHTCDGQGACKLGPGQPCSAAGECASPFCSDGVCCASACEGLCEACDVSGSAGACVFVPPGGEDDWPDQACVAPFACDGAGVCKAGNGELCAVPEECGSGFCVDGVCCDAACGAVCESCVVASHVGTCWPTPAMSADPPACSTGFACDGGGACKTANAEACQDDEDCASGQCEDGVCCAADCAQACMTCARAGQVGTCVPSESGASDAACDDGSVCDGQGSCKKALGETCIGGDECLLGLCVDGRCCDRACAGQCEACDVAGSFGTCSPVDGEPHGERPPCAGPTSGDPCTASACLGAASTTSCEGWAGADVRCREASCSSGVEVQVSFCAGSGSCPPAVTRSCDLYACGDDSCLTSCTQDSDCANPVELRCDTSTQRCVARDSAICDTETSVLSPSGDRTDCSPYKCFQPEDGSGDRCLSSCSTTTDCVEGYVCDKLQGDGVCARPSDDGGSDAGGCGCTVVGRTRSGGWMGLGILAAAWLLRRGRKSSNERRRECG